MAKQNFTPIPYVTYHVRLGLDGQPKKNRDKSLSILTLVRVPKFKRISKTFKSQAEAEAWARPLVNELLAPKNKGARPDMSTLTIRGLIKEYLEDPGVRTLRSYSGYVALSRFWEFNYGAVKVLEFGPQTLFDSRDKLRKGRIRVRDGKQVHDELAPATVNRSLALMRAVWQWGKSTGRIPGDRAWPRKLFMPEPFTDYQLRRPTAPHEVYTCSSAIQS